MSFLLRNNNNNPSKKRTGLGGGSGINVRPNHPQQRNHKIHAAAPSSRTAHHHGQQQQQQVLIQRPPIQQQQRPAVQQQSAVQKQGQEQDGSAMISMDDVMRDIQLLEQQQRDSQRQLEKAQIIKQQRLDQQAKLERQHEQLKFSNGELRAQLEKARQILSAGTRTLNVRKLADDKIGNDLRALERKLQQGLQVASMIQFRQRQIDSLILQVESQQEQIRKRCTAAQLAETQAEEEFLRVKRQEESLLQAIQQEQAVLQELHKSIAAHEQEYETYNANLMVAQNAEQKSKHRVEALTKDMEAETKRSASAIEASTAELLEISKALQDWNVQEVAKKEELAKQAKELETEWNRILQYQSEQGHEPSAPFSMEAELPVFDLPALHASVASKAAQVTELESELEEEDKLIAELEAELAQVEEANRADEQEAEELEAANAIERKAQETRRAALDAAAAEFQAEKDEVAELNKAFKAMEATQTNQSLQLQEQLELQDQEIEHVEQELVHLEEAVEEAIAETEQMAGRLEAEQEDWQNKIAIATAEANETEQKLAKIMEKIEILEQGDIETVAATFPQFALIKQKAEEELAEYDEKLEALFDAHPPELKEIAFEPDLSKHPDILFKEQLSDVIALNQFLKTKKKEYKQAKQTAKAQAREKKKTEEEDAKRKKQEQRRNEVEVQRKEQERVERKARLRAEDKEDDDNPGLFMDDDEVEGEKPTQNPKPRRRKSKGSDFYMPASQGDIETPRPKHDETPLQKQLLSTFEKQVASPTPSQDKRVHWKDGLPSQAEKLVDALDDDHEAVEDDLVEQEPVDPVDVPNEDIDEEDTDEEEKEEPVIIAGRKKRAAYGSSKADKGVEATRKRGSSKASSRDDKSVSSKRSTSSMASKTSKTKSREHDPSQSMSNPKPTVKNSKGDLFDELDLNYEGKSAKSSLSLSPKYTQASKKKVAPSSSSKGPVVSGSNKTKEKHSITTKEKDPKHRHSSSSSQLSSASNKEKDPKRRRSSSSSQLSASNNEKDPKRHRSSSLSQLSMSKNEKAPKRHRSGSSGSSQTGRGRSKDHESSGMISNKGSSRSRSSSIEQKSKEKPASSSGHGTERISSSRSTDILDDKNKKSRHADKPKTTSSKYKSKPSDTSVLSKKSTSSKTSRLSKTSVTSKSSRLSKSTKPSGASKSKKRGASTFSSSQASGISSMERAAKHPRRRKKAVSSTQGSKSTMNFDDGEDFHF